MDREVGFGDDHNSAHPEWFELVEGHVNDRGLAGLGCRYHDVPDGVNLFE